MTRIEPVECPDCGCFCIVRPGNGRIVAHWAGENKCRANELTMEEAKALPKLIDKAKLAEALANAGIR